MKAKDLAALAALGVAGFAAYDKFGKKKPAQSGAKAGAKLGDGERDGEAGEREARMNMRDMNEGSVRRDAGGNTEKQSRQERDVPEKLSRQELDVPEKVVSRQERDVPDRIMGRDAAGSRFTDKAAAPVAVAKPVRKQEVEARSLDSTGGPSRYNRAADSNAAGSAYDATAPVAQRIAALNAANGAASDSARKTDALAVDSRANQAAYLKQKQDQALVPDYSNEGRNKTPVADLRKINAASGASTPSALKTDALAVGSRANQAAYLEKQRLAQNQLNAQKLKASRQAEANQAAMEAIQAKKAAPVPRFAGKGPGLGALSGMRKGGVVKMASGGMTSSKPSSASSRGDGIAQRGKTRGQMR